MQRDEQSIREFISTWVDASKRGETRKALRLMAEDAVFLVQPGLLTVVRA